MTTFGLQRSWASLARKMSDNMSVDSSVVGGDDDEFDVDAGFAAQCDGNNDHEDGERQSGKGDKVSGKGHYDRKKEYSRPPMRKDVLESIGWDVLPEDTFKSKNDFELAVREANEVRGKIVATGIRTHPTKPKNPKDLPMKSDATTLTFCCKMRRDDDSACSYYVRGKKRRGEFIVEAVVPHNCKNCDTPEELQKELATLSRRGVGRTNYKAPHLFPILKDLITCAMSSKRLATRQTRGS